jgi:hypothetical protein
MSGLPAFSSRSIFIPTPTPPTPIVMAVMVAAPVIIFIVPVPLIAALPGIGVALTWLKASLPTTRLLRIGLNNNLLDHVVIAINRSRLIADLRINLLRLCWYRQEGS